jgi:hypothetical protein
MQRTQQDFMQLLLVADGSLQDVPLATAEPLAGSGWPVTVWVRGVAPSGLRSPKASRKR